MRTVLVVLGLAVLAWLAVACSGGADPVTLAEPTTTTTTTPVSSTTTTTTSTTTTTTTTTLFPDPAVSTVPELLALERPVIAGHAGGDQSWPHSTMFGFREAARAGVDVLELDVQLTGDGVLVVHHDDTTDRTSNSSGAVRDLTLAELQVLDNAYWWSAEWSSHDLPADAYLYRGIRTGDLEPPASYTADDFRVETFATIAETFPNHILDIEIKIPAGANGQPDVEFGIAGAQVLADEIARLERTDSVIVVSFDSDIMAAFRGFAPDVVTSPATNEMLAWFFGTSDFTAADLIAQVPPDFDGIEVMTPEIVDRVKAAGLEIWVWPNDVATQETAEYYVEAVKLGADGIIAGRPAVAVDAYRAEGWLR